MKKKISLLEKEIIRHKSLYYQGKAEISNESYDQLEDDLKQIDPNNYVFSIVGSEVDSLTKIKHDSKMLSLNKTYSTDDLIKWIDKKEIISTFKIDGVSCSLIYKNDELILGKTRGDGIFGENITNKIKWISSIPKKISSNYKTFEIRGELYCNANSFLNLAIEMKDRNMEVPSSERNIVAGLISRKENIDLSRHLSFQAFEIIGIDFKNEKEKFLKLANFGLNTPNFKILSNEQEIKKYIEFTSDFMINGDYLIDGIVFTYNDIQIHNSLGETAHHPKYKMAFKFKGESKITTIRDIHWSISRNGVLTPVGKVEPVDLSGAKISRVTLHNFGLVKLYNLKSGDKIEIIRSGEVIPKFLSIIEDGKQKFSYPANCPHCNHSTIINDIRLLCPNKNCSARVKEEILNFVQKIGINDLSSKRLETFLSSKLVRTIPDLYKLKEEQLIELDKVKDKLAKKIILNIQNTLNVDFTTFLSALGISSGAFNTCQKLVESGFDSVEKIKKLTEEDLCKLDKFAEKSSKEFISSLKTKFDLIDKLVVAGFKFKKIIHTSKRRLEGLKVCITGALSEKRNVIEQRIRVAGGSITGTVSKNTDFLLTNETDSSSSKFLKAKKNNISVISEVDLKKMLNP